MLTLMVAAGYLALLPLIIPVTVWLRYVSWIARQPPGQRVELTKASHGAGMLALSGEVVLLVQGQGIAVSSMPLLWVPLGIMVIWGALWLVTSGLQARLYGAQGPLDVVILVRSMVKVGVGGVIAHFLAPFQPAQVLAALPRMTDNSVVLFALACIAGWFIAWWCVSTGAAKILLLVLARIRRRSRKTPPPMQDPRGGARDASRAEARNAMRGAGGVTSKLDSQEF